MNGDASEELIRELQRVEVSPQYGVIRSSPGVAEGEWTGGSTVVNPLAKEWSDVLRYGVARAIDSRFLTPVQPQSYQPQLWNGRTATNYGPVNGLSMSWGVAALLALGVGVGLWALSK
jgi:hypothetical protein